REPRVDTSENFLRGVAVERLAAIKDRDPDVELALATLRPDDPETSCRAVPIGRPFHELDPDTGDRTVVIQIAVRRPLDATLRELLDPQSWDSLGSFFEKSYVIEDGIIDDPVPPQPAAVPQPPGIPRRGTAWKAPLFEVAASDDTGIGVFRFPTILGIHTSATRGRYRCDYRPRRCAFSEIPGAGNGPGCLV